MFVTFIGVGEAFDEMLPNTCVLVSPTGGNRGSVLLDCGYTAPFAFRRLSETPLDLDAVWISHFHGDHYFGLSALLLYFYEKKRTKPFTLVGQAGLRDKTLQCMEAAYPGVADRFGFALESIEIEENTQIQAFGYTFEAARSDHPQKNFSLKLTDEDSSMFYSGDGRPTSETAALARDAKLIIHESFSMEADTPGHGTIPGSIEFARNAGARALALVHIRRDVRRTKVKAVRELLEITTDVQVIMPDPGFSMDVSTL